MFACTFHLFGSERHACHWHFQFSYSHRVQWACWVSCCYFSGSVFGRVDGSLGFNRGDPKTEDFCPENWLRRQWHNVTDPTSLSNSFTKISGTSQNKKTKMQSQSCSFFTPSWIGCFKAGGHDVMDRFRGWLYRTHFAFLSGSNLVIVLAFSCLAVAKFRGYWWKTKLLRSHLRYK